MTKFDEADAVARYQALVQVEIKNRQKANDQRLARALIVADAKRNLKAPAYKAFLTKIDCADSTQRELLKIAKAGSADEVRRATALRVAQHRERKAAAVTSGNVTALPLTPAEGVKLAASEGVTMTEPEVAECLKLADMTEPEFEKHVAAEVAPPVVPEQIPEPVAEFPIIGKTTTADAVSVADMTLREIDRVFAGLDYNNEETLRYAPDVDLEYYDVVQRAYEHLQRITQSLRYVDPIHDAMSARQKAEREEHLAERKRLDEAAEAARVARIKWEIDHGDEARTAYRTEALAIAKRDHEYETDEGDFDQAAFDAAYKPGEDGAVGYDNPEKNFFERWYKEHHTIWPGHLEAELEHVDRFDRRRNRQRERQMTQLMDALENLPHVTDMKKARKLYDAADEHGSDFAAACALADFVKVARPARPKPSLECDHKLDPADNGRAERWDALWAWEDANLHYIAAKSVLDDKLFRHDDPKSAARNDQQRTKKEAETKKRLVAEAKSPAKTKTKALKGAKAEAMDSDMEEAKEDARENQERWGDLKEQWITDWEAENWDEDAQAEAEQEFLDTWEFEHGKAFPASNYAK